MLIKGRHCKIFLKLLLFSFGFFGITQYASAQNIEPPIAKIIQKADTLFGDIRIDNYYWLIKVDDPDVITYLEAENKYTETMMAHTEKFQQQLYEELKNRIKETDISVPDKIDDYYYYTRTEQGKQYSIFCRKIGNLDAPEQILLDENLLAQDHRYFNLGAYETSPDHQFMAYTVDTTGGEMFTLYIKDLMGDTLIKDMISDIDYYIAWANDNRTLFYAVLDSVQRPYKLYRHILGTNVREDVMVYHEKDAAFFMDIAKTRSKKYLLINLQSKTTTEVRYLDADQSYGKFKLINRRKNGVEYYVDHNGDNFYILTNDHAKNFRLMKAPVAKSSRKNWKDVILHRDSVLLEGFDVFRNYLTLYERENGLQKLRTIDLATNESHYADFSEPVYTYWALKNPNFDTDIIRFGYTSLVKPISVFDYDMRNRKLELKKQTEVIGYNPELYTSERFFAQAIDSSKIPISIVYKKGMIKDGKNPLILDGYGAYSGSNDPWFSSSRLSLLDRGFIYAIAHVRGGGEMGRYWYEQGKLLNKKNTFADFIVCAEYLIANKYTSPDNLIIIGGSAGGILIGAVINMRPELFKGAVADVPFVDVLNTMLDPSIPLTVLEYGEWGNPHNEKYYYYIKSYAPYENVKAQNYPNLLITAGLNDPRVGYWEPAKWTAKLRALKTDNNILLLKTNMAAGHGGVSGRYDFMKEIAFEYGFILGLFGVEK